MICENVSGVPCVGAIAQSIAGRDKKRYFVIVGYEYCEHRAMVYIADGALHKLSRPKKKNLKHLRIVAPATPELSRRIAENRMTDAALCALLAEKSL